MPKVFYYTSQCLSDALLFCVCVWMSLFGCMYVLVSLISCVCMSPSLSPSPLSTFICRYFFSFSFLVCSLPRVFSFNLSPALLLFLYIFLKLYASHSITFVLGLITLWLYWGGGGRWQVEPCFCFDLLIGQKLFYGSLRICHYYGSIRQGYFFY